MSNRSKAFFINGGAGRVLCAIPALLKYQENSGDDDFVIICEGGMEFFRGHPTLYKRCYDNWHKGLFNDILIDKDLISPEPYRVWEYFNQKASLIESFDIEINGRDSEGELKDPELLLNKPESIKGYQALQEIKAGTGKDKVIIIQPFGRGVEQTGEFIHDASSRSIEFNNLIGIIQELRTKYAVIIMSEFNISVPEDNDNPVACPQGVDLRTWSSMIGSCDHFLGCDSVGQHIAKALGKPATVVVGSTYPVNISYPDWENFDIIDIGKETRVYSPIRISMDDVADRSNDKCMMMTDEQVAEVIDSCTKSLGEPVKFTGTFTPAQSSGGCGEAPVNTYPSYDMTKQIT